MIFRAFLLSVNEANAYIVGCRESREALMVDAGEFNAGIEDFLDEHHLRLTQLFITHDHYDHTEGVAEYVERYNVRVLSAAGRLGGMNATRVRHGDVVKVGAWEGKVLLTGGHTNDSISLCFPGLVFTGDALFAGSIGGTSSPDQARREIEGIRNHIFTLPAEYEIHPGHGPSSTVWIERSFNPFFV